MTKDEALRMALEALKADPLEMVADVDGHMVFRKEQAITAIKKFLAQPEQEPMAWISTGPARMIHWTSDKPAYGDDWVPLYTTPPQRKPLTLGQKQRLWSSVGDKPTLKDRVNAYGLAIEAAHGIKE